MTYDQEILLEQYFPYTNMDEQDRTFYLNLLLSSQELSSSDYNLSETSPSRYDIVCMTLNNEGVMVRFNGAISNGEENKLIDGIIFKRRSGYCIFSNVYRLSEKVFENKEYRTIDEFSFKDEIVKRKSAYNEMFKKPVVIQLKTPGEMEEFYQSKLGPREEKIDL